MCVLKNDLSCCIHLLNGNKIEGKVREIKSMVDNIRDPNTVTVTISLLNLMNC